MRLRRVILGISVAVGLVGPLPAQSTSGLRALGQAYEAAGWEAVGRLDLGGGFCTGTLIAPDVVLSAAHCVYDQAGRLRNPEDMRFNAGLRHGAAAARRGVRKIVAHPGFDPVASTNRRTVSYDVALLQLSSPIPTGQINPFVLHGDRVQPGPVSVVSYGRGRSETQSRQKECNLLARQDGFLAFDCDVTFGSSGAPVFSHLNGRGRILSVISGGTTAANGKQVALGPHLPALVAELRRDLVTAQTGPAPKIRRIQVGGARTAGGAKFVRP